MAGYRAIHDWVQRHKGKASMCEIEPAHKAVRFHWSNISGEYKRDLDDYRQLCPSCHAKIDRPLKEKCAKGHYYTAENTIMHIRGYRQCRICQYGYMKKWVQSKKMELVI